MTFELPDITLSADVELDIDDESDRVKHARRQHLIERYAPRIVSYPVGINVPASGAITGYVTDSPVPGRRLEIRRFHLDIAQPITGAGLTAEPTTITTFLVADAGGAASGSGVNLSSANVIKRYAASALPIDDTWPAHVAVVRSPMNIYLICFNTAGSAIALAGNLQTVDMPDDEFDEPSMVYHILSSFKED